MKMMIMMIHWNSCLDFMHRWKKANITNAIWIMDPCLLQQGALIFAPLVDVKKKHCQIKSRVYYGVSVWFFFRDILWKKFKIGGDNGKFGGRREGKEIKNDWLVYLRAVVPLAKNSDIIIINTLFTCGYAMLLKLFVQSPHESVSL